MSKRLTTDLFIQRSKITHGEKYDYSKVEYNNSQSKVCIICPIHGEFWQVASEHIRGCGCPICGKNESIEKKSDTCDVFIEKARAIHGFKYNYSNVKYINSYTKVNIICPIHGEFLQEPHTHLKGSGCPKCGYDKQKKLIFDIGINDCNLKDKSYKVWHGMITRCYSEEFKKKNPSYLQCSVCEEWLTYSNFKKWFDENYREGCDLDKDVLVKGNKVYSPCTCVFIPHRINTLLISCCQARGTLPVGVSHYDKNKYQVKIRVNGTKKHIGYFNSKEDAFIAYKDAKERYIKDVAMEYYNNKLINEDVFNSLMEWEVQITD